MANAKTPTTEPREVEIVTDEIMNAKHNNARLVEARQAVDAYFSNPSDDNQDLVANNTRAIHDLLYMCKEYEAAIADLKARIEYCVVNLFDYVPALEEHFKVQGGAKSCKCDNRPDSMFQLMEAWCKEGYDPSGLFGICSAITSKKAAEAFGLSEEAFLEKYGHLFKTHVNKPSVKMVY